MEQIRHSAVVKCGIPCLMTFLTIAQRRSKRFQPHSALDRRHVDQRAKERIKLMAVGDMQSEYCITVEWSFDQEDNRVSS